MQVWPEKRPAKLPERDGPHTKPQFSISEKINGKIQSGFRKSNSREKTAVRIRAKKKPKRNGKRETSSERRKKLFRFFDKPKRKRPHLRPRRAQGGNSGKGDRRQTRRRRREAKDARQKARGNSRRGSKIAKLGIGKCRFGQSAQRKTIADKKWSFRIPPRRAQ